MAQYKTVIGRVAFGNMIEPQTSDYGNVEWVLGFVVDEPGANQILGHQEDELESYRSRSPLNAKFPALSALKNGIKPSEKKNEDGTKEPDEGFFLAVFKRKTTWKSKQGDVNKNVPPKMYDSVGRLIDPIDVPRGSKGLVVYEHSIYNNPGNQGVSLRLVGFQIAELAEGNDLKMDAIEGGTFVAEPTEEMLDI